MSDVHNIEDECKPGCHIWKNIKSFDGEYTENVVVCRVCGCEFNEGT